MNRIAAWTLVALVLVTPVAGARMVLAPRELALDVGAVGTFEIELFNGASGPVRFAVELHAPGLQTTTDRASVTIPARASATIVATVRADEASPAERTVSVTLYEGNDPSPVETQHVAVRVGRDVAGTLALAAGALSMLSVGALIGFASWRRWDLLAAALYTRLRREAIDAHPSRAKILDAVRASPGLALADAQRATGLANGPFEHHLRKLVDARRVVIVAEGRSRFLRLPDAPPSAAPGTTTGAIEALIRDKGAMRSTQIARELGLSRQALHYHLRKLSAEGRVDVRLARGRVVVGAKSGLAVGRGAQLTDDGSRSPTPRPPP